MGSLIFGVVILLVALVVRASGASLKTGGSRVSGTLINLVSLVLGAEEQIHNVVVNAIRNGVRNGMAQFSINDIAQRGKIADAMRAEVDSALVTQPRAGGEHFRIATVTAFYLRNLQPPEQVVNAI